MAFSEVRTYGLPPPNVRSYSYYVLPWAHHQSIAITFERTALTPTCKTACLPLISHPPVLFSSLVAEQLSLYFPCLTTATPPHQVLLRRLYGLKSPDRTYRRMSTCHRCLPNAQNNAHRVRLKPFLNGQDALTRRLVQGFLGLGLFFSPLVCVLLRVCPDLNFSSLYGTYGPRTAHFLCYTAFSSAIC